jgi:hypothetical protein
MFYELKEELKEDIQKQLNESQQNTDLKEKPQGDTEPTKLIQRGFQQL